MPVEKRRGLAHNALTLAQQLLGVTGEFVQTYMKILHRWMDFPPAIEPVLPREGIKRIANRPRKIKPLSWRFCGIGLSLIHQPPTFAPNFCPRDRSPRQVRAVQLVEIFSAKSHIGRAAQQNRPAIPGK